GLRMSDNKDLLYRANMRTAVVAMHVIISISAYVYTILNNMLDSNGGLYKTLVVLTGAFGIPISYLLMASIVKEIAMIDGVIVTAFFAGDFWPMFNRAYVIVLAVVATLIVLVYVPFISFENIDIKRKLRKEEKPGVLGDVYAIVVFTMIVSYILCCLGIDINGEQNLLWQVATIVFFVSSHAYTWLENVV
ncbi:MAG: hypothetical protein K6G26_12090, partial [Lachnospiraceae bacterium]|nr:hypothetical protein [Lachnospiraceae bacterium]